MKKNLFLPFILFGFLFSCTNEEDVITSVGNNVVQPSNIRTYDEALKIAKDAVGMLDGNYTTRTASSKRVVDEDDCVILRNKKTRSSGNSLDTLMYIFNYSDNEGFAIVSANKATEGLLAVTEAGHYDGGTDSEIEGLNEFIDLAEIYVSTINITRMEPLTPISSTDTIWTIDNHLINTKWAQTGVTGQYCPNGVAGCVPLAVAEILSYHKYPSSIALSYSGADMSTQILDWEEINKHIIQRPTCTASDSAHNALGRLCRQLGQIMNSTYNYYGSTSTYRENVPSCFSLLGYNVNGWNDYSSDCCVLPISNSHPLIVAGRRYTTNGTSGHEWIVDGYIQRIITNSRWVVYSDGTSGWETSSDTSTYNHVNWGWGGSANGYYYDGVFNTSDYYELDPNVSSVSSYNYQINIQYLEAYR